MMTPARKSSSVTIGSACTPHSWTTTARSRQRKRARPVTSRPSAGIASPRNASASTVDIPGTPRAEPDALEPRGGGVDRARALLLGHRLGEPQEALHGRRQAAAVDRHAVPSGRGLHLGDEGEHAGVPMLQPGQVEDHTCGRRRCRKRLLDGQRSGQPLRQPPRSGSTPRPASRPDRARPPTARPGPRPRRFGSSLASAPHRGGSLLAPRRTTSTVPRGHQLDALAARQPQSLDVQPEGRQLPRHRIAGARGRQPARQQDGDAQAATPPRARLVVIDDEQRRSGSEAARSSPAPPAATPARPGRRGSSPVRPRLIGRGRALRRPAARPQPRGLVPRPRAARRSARAARGSEPPARASPAAQTRPSSRRFSKMARVAGDWLSV